MEILQNTLIQLIVRQGSDADRQSILIKSGEPVFTTDTHRLYVGNGALSGGTLVGNKFQGIGPTITNFIHAVSGDLAYDTNTNTLNVLTTNSGSTFTDWTPIANLSNPIYVKYDGVADSINFSRNISTSTKLSAGHYRFTYGPLPTSNLIPTTEIFGLSALGYQARTISISNSACDVKVVSLTGASTDAIITLMINY